MLQFAMPRYSPSFDWDAARSVPSRVRLLDTIAAEAALLISPHVPFPGVGRVASKGAARHGRRGHSALPSTAIG